MWNQIELIAKSGTAVLVVEQNVERALKHADFVHIFVAGTNHVHGPTSEIAAAGPGRHLLGASGSDAFVTVGNSHEFEVQKRKKGEVPNEIH